MAGKTVFLETTLFQNMLKKVGKDHLGSDLPERLRSLLMHDETNDAVRCRNFFLYVCVIFISLLSVLT